jgi:hypothetical protein
VGYNVTVITVHAADWARPTLPNLLFVFFLFVIRVVLLLIVMFYVLFMCKYVLQPGVNPIAVDKYINTNLVTTSLGSAHPHRDFCAHSLFYMKFR